MTSSNKRSASKDRSKEREAKLTHISVKGYKSLGKELKIRVAPLTLLAGVNSSGKSSFFQPFLLLKQTQEASYEPHGILLNGPNAKIYSADGLFSEKGKGQRRKDFEVSYYFDDNACLKNVYGKKQGFGLDIIKSKVKFGGNSFELTSHPKRSSILNILSIDLEDKNLYKEAIQSMHFIPSVSLRRGFLDINLIHKESGGTLTGGGGYNHYVSKARSFNKFLHIPGIRGNPERNYKFSTSKAPYIGRFEDYTASIIFSWANSKKSIDQTKLKLLKVMLRRLGLTTSIRADKVSDAYIKIEVGALPNVTSKIPSINIADVGFGVSQVLPVLVALIESTKGQVVYIEQPELHLHPKAQAVMGEILCQFAKSNRFVIIETHSSIILRKIQTLVAKKKLSPDLVSLNWFWMRNNGFSDFAEANLDKKGRYGDWPEDFDDVYLDVESEYMRAAV